MYEQTLDYLHRQYLIASGAEEEQIIQALMDFAEVYHDIGEWQEFRLLIGAMAAAIPVTPPAHPLPWVTALFNRHVLLLQRQMMDDMGR